MTRIRETSEKYFIVFLNRQIKDLVALQQSYDVARDTALIENNGITPKLIANNFNLCNNYTEMTCG